MHQLKLHQTPAPDLPRLHHLCCLLILFWFQQRSIWAVFFTCTLTLNLLFSRYYPSGALIPENFQNTHTYTSRSGGPPKAKTTPSLPADLPPRSLSYPSSSSLLLSQSPRCHSFSTFLGSTLRPSLVWKKLLSLFFLCLTCECLSGLEIFLSVWALKQTPFFFTVSSLFRWNISAAESLRVPGCQGE